MASTRIAIGWSLCSPRLAVLFLTKFTKVHKGLLPRQPGIYLTRSREDAESFVSPSAETSFNQICFLKI
jgi:hypothetical protein